MKGHSRSMFYGLVVLAVLVVSSGVAFGVDGVILIDQASLVGGFPVSITQPGSYKLSSNLKGDQRGFGVIVINSNDVTIDLNGFNIDANFAAAIFSHGNQPFRNIEIRNGSLSNVTAGIELPQATHVAIKELRVNTVNPRQTAINVGQYAILHHNTTNGLIFVNCPGVVTENVTESRYLEFTGRAIIPCIVANNSLGGSPP
jgi:hypothetical protein